MTKKIQGQAISVFFIEKVNCILFSFIIDYYDFVIKNNGLLIKHKSKTSQELNYLGCTRTLLHCLTELSRSAGANEKNLRNVFFPDIFTISKIWAFPLFPRARNLKERKLSKMNSLGGAHR